MGNDTSCHDVESNTATEVIKIYTGKQERKLRQHKNNECFAFRDKQWCFSPVNNEAFLPSKDSYEEDRCANNYNPSLTGIPTHAMKFAKRLGYM